MRGRGGKRRIAWAALASVLAGAFLMQFCSTPPADEWPAAAVSHHFATPPLLEAGSAAAATQPD
jgi:hypothetical protein